jgi:HNH endonuclease
MGNRYGTCPVCGKSGKVYGVAPDLWCSKCNQTRKVKSPCACGCGELTLNTFVSGHNVRLLSPEEQGRRGRQNIKVDWSSVRPLVRAKYKKVAGRHEHKWVAEVKLGRPLQKGEIVHHIDGNSWNNDPSNLQVMTQSEHCKAHDFGRKKHG